MRIALVVTYGKLSSSEGSRIISALLKNAGHCVKSVFLTRVLPIRYEQQEIEQLHDILSNVDLVMVATYSAYVYRAIQVTQFVHQTYPGMKVIWGGPHCIAAPDLTLRHADGVCFAEGDEVIVDLVNKIESNSDYTDTPNMAFNENGTHVVNNVLPPFSDLDSLPYPDHNLNDHFLLDRELFQMTKKTYYENSRKDEFGRPRYYIMTSRGCPHKCSYCNNCLYLAMHGRNPMRYRSVDNFVGELENHLGRFDAFGRVIFGDDDFFIRPTDQIEDFAEKYRKRIGLPFMVTVSANTYKKEKMEALLDAGMIGIEMGIQSGSQRVLDEVFHRKVKVSKTKELLPQFELYQKTHELRCFLDFIIDNPYETRDDIIQTYQYLISTSLRASIRTFRLAFFPGTPLYDRAAKDGFIDPSSIDSLSDERPRSVFGESRGQVRYQQNYETFLVLLARFLHSRNLLRKIPRSVLQMLGSRLVTGVASIFPASFYGYLIERTPSLS